MFNYSMPVYQSLYADKRTESSLPFFFVCRIRELAVVYVRFIPIMKANNSIDIERIINQLIDMVSKLDASLHLNERYVHHLFSALIQKEIQISLVNDGKVHLHPEWATSIKGGQRVGGRYKENKVNKKYEINGSEGHPGFIDFVVGNFDSDPEYAIEFKMDERFDSKGIKFDYLKLLDPNNRIGTSYSLVIYYGHTRESQLFKDGKRIQKCLDEAKTEIKDKRKFRNTNPYHFYVIEILNNKVVHRYEANNGDFLIVD